MSKVSTGADFDKFHATTRRPIISSYDSVFADFYYYRYSGNAFLVNNNGTTHSFKSNDSSRILKALSFKDCIMDIDYYTEQAMLGGLGYIPYFGTALEYIELAYSIQEDGLTGETAIKAIDAICATIPLLSTFYNTTFTISNGALAQASRLNAKTLFDQLLKY